MSLSCKVRCPKQLSKQNQKDKMVSQQHHDYTSQLYCLCKQLTHVHSSCIYAVFVFPCAGNVGIAFRWLPTSSPSPSHGQYDHCSHLQHQVQMGSRCIEREALLKFDTPLGFRSNLPSSRSISNS